MLQKFNHQAKNLSKGLLEFRSVNPDGVRSNWNLFQKRPKLE